MEQDVNILVPIWIFESFWRWKGIDLHIAAAARHRFFVHITEIYLLESDKIFLWILIFDIFVPIWYSARRMYLDCPWHATVKPLRVP